MAIRFHEVSGNRFREEKRQKSEPFAKGSDFWRFSSRKWFPKTSMEVYICGLLMLYCLWFLGCAFPWIFLKWRKLSLGAPFGKTVHIMSSDGSNLLSNLIAGLFRAYLGLIICGLLMPYSLWFLGSPGSFWSEESYAWGPLLVRQYK